VIEADDFEAGLQTFLRNQHGTMNPVLLGRMFQDMLKQGKLSNRALGRKIKKGESFVRVALDYATAYELRNACAPLQAEADVAGLTVQQVKQYLKLPSEKREAWLDGVLATPKTGKKRGSGEKTSQKSKQDYAGASQIVDAKDADKSTPEASDIDAPQKELQRSQQVAENSAAPPLDADADPEEATKKVWTFDDVKGDLAKALDALSLLKDEMNAMQPRLCSLQSVDLAAVWIQIGELAKAAVADLN
jgi:hypothetical protein